MLSARAVAGTGFVTSYSIPDISDKLAKPSVKRQVVMLCEKCGMPHMIEDFTSEVEVYRCWVCGNRIYVNHPMCGGFLTCSRCGGPIGEKNVLTYCRKCWDGLRIFKKRGSRISSGQLSSCNTAKRKPRAGKA